MSRSFRCPQCGASVDFPDDRVSDACAFCEAPLVRAQADAAGTPAEPIDLVAPFDLEGTQAAERLRQYLARHRWAPEAVRRASRPEELRAVLVPFWVHDAHARSTWSARVGIHWWETRTRTVWVNGKPTTRVERVRRTEWHACEGTHVHAYDDQLVSGSTGLSEAEANALEPFDLGRALPFAPALLAGQLAERPSISHAQARDTCAQELAQLENREIRAFLPGDESSEVRNQTEVEVQAVRLALLPVWIATYPWKGEVLRLLVNGQTGEVVGRLPRSWAKIGCVVLLLLGLALVAFACLGGFASLAAALDRAGVL